MTAYYRKVLVAIVAMVIANCGFVSASDYASLEAELNRQFESKSLTFRNPYHAKDLVFSSSGQLVASAEQGTWVSDGSFLVGKVRVQVGGLKFDGHPLVMYYDENVGKNFAVRPGSVHVALQMDQPPDASSVRAAMEKVFLTDKDTTPYLPPPTFDHLSGGFERKPGASWGAKYRLKGASKWLEPKDIPETIEAGEWENGEKIFVVTGPNTPPKALYQPDPEYPNEERKAKRNGSAVLDVVVDSAGRVGGIRVEKATSPAFAAASAIAVSQWRFQPAMLNARPVTVLIIVETNFRLY